MIDISTLNDDEKIDLANSTDSPELLRRLSTEEDALVAVAVVSNPSTPQDVLLKFLKDERPFIRHMVASERNLPAYIFDEIINGKNEAIRPDQIAGNEYLTHAQLAKLAHNKDEVVRLKVAANNATPGKVLDFLSNDVFRNIVHAVARNENTPVLTLRKLIYSKELIVRLLIMEHPNFPPEYLVTLAKDQEDVVRSKVACASTASVNILRKLSKDKNPQVVVDAINNPNFPEDTLKELVDSSDPFVREAVAANINVTSELVESLANDEHVKVRVAVAYSPKTSVETLFKMLHDEEPEVKNTAKFMLSYVSDKGFETALINNGYSQYVGLPRDWVLKAL